MSDELKLGGNIVLSGFTEFDRAELSIIKKLVGAYARKFSEEFGVEELKITLKPVHQIEKSEKFEIRAAAFKSGKPINSDTTDKNVYFAVDSVLKKIEEQLK